MAEEQPIMPVVVTEEGGDFSSDKVTWRNYSTTCEIEEEEEEDINRGVLLNRQIKTDPMPSIKEELDGSSSLLSLDFHGGGEDVVYVAVGKTGSSSMDALVWTLNHAVINPSTSVCLIHVFPEIRHISTPLGRMPLSQVNPEQKESHMIQERSKRREFLQKFLDVCSASKVKVDTILIESGMEAKALLDLIPILNIPKLVLGTTKSSLRKLRSRRGSGIAGQVLQNAPEFCEVKIICEGKEVVVDSMSEPPSPHGSSDSPKAAHTEQNQRNDSFSCTCFKPKAIA